MLARLFSDYVLGFSEISEVTQAWKLWQWRGIVANKVRGFVAPSAGTSRPRVWHANTLALDIVKLWLVTPFAGDRHARRIALIE